MKIIDILNQDQITLSFEVFPPKKIEKYDSVQAATEGVAALHPSFMSEPMVRAAEPPSLR